MEKERRGGQLQQLDGAQGQARQPREVKGNVGAVGELGGNMSTSSHFLFSQLEVRG